MTTPLIQLADFLQPGLRTIDPAGGLLAPVADVAETVERLCVIDLEMSGPNAQVHEVLDVGMVLVAVEDGFQELDSWGTRVMPRRIGNADRGALKVVGYDPRRWRGAAQLEDVAQEIVRRAAGTALAGWGLESDLAFLRYTFAHLGVEWPFAGHVIDVQHIARKTLAGTGLVDRFNLGHVADRLGLGRLGEHSALADAYATYDVLAALWSRSARDEGPSG